MKRIFASLICIAVLAGCSNADGKPSENQKESIVSSKITSSEKDISAEYTPTPSEREATVSHILSLENNDASYDKLIKKKIDGDQFIRKFFYRMYHPAYGYIEQLDQIDHEYPVECIRDMGDGKKYVIYKSDDGGLFYVYFRYDTDKSHCVYLSKLKQKKDFDNIKVGSSFEQVVRVDPDTSKWIDEDIPAYMSAHLLRDGILVFTYEEDKVTNIYYSPDYLYKRTVGDVEIEYDYSVLEQDLPK